MRKTRKLTIASLAMVFALSMVFAFSFWGKNVLVRADEDKADPSAIFDLYLDAGELPGVVVNDTKEYGEFILQGSAQAPLSIDGNVKTSMDEDLKPYEFTQRIKFEGKSSHTDLSRTISFYLEKQAEIRVFAVSASSSDADRTLALYKNGQSAAVKSNKVAASANALEALIYTTTDAGSYYFAADVNGVNVYFIGIKYTGDAPDVPRGNWSNVAVPSITTPVLSEDGRSLEITYNANIGLDGADMLYVKMYDAQMNYITRRTVLKFGTTGKVSFTPAASGNYYFDVEAVRKKEATGKSSASPVEFNFTLVLEKPTVRARTGENTLMVATISEIVEAEKYILSYKLTSAEAWEVVEIPAAPGEIVKEISGYAVGNIIQFKVQVVRGSETVDSDVISATVRNAPERDWQFTYFGQSTKKDLNYMLEGGNIYDGVSLVSCSKGADGETLGKGGKYTYGAMDGISFYYTKIKANEEDFKLRARVVVDYLNPTVDGQEGFALLVRDSIGIHGDTGYFYTNSVAAIATKIQYSQGAAKKDIKDGIGARFVTGVPNTTTAPTGVFTQKMYPFNYQTIQPTVNKALDGYIMEIEKENNCYYVRYYEPKYDGTGDYDVTQYTLYHDGSVNNGADGKDQMMQIDKEYIYVGFSVARGCDATFTDIDFTVTPKSNTPIQIQNEKIVGDYAITSPETTSLSDYIFKFSANADGKLSAKLNGTDFITDQDIKAFVDFKTTVKLTQMSNTFDAVFTPAAGYKPDTYEEMESYTPQSIKKDVTYNYYGTVKNVIIVAPTSIDISNPNRALGKANGDGSMENPLDLQTAVNYLLPGQTILMLDGTYSFGGNLTIERGNDGDISKNEDGTYKLKQDNYPESIVYKYIRPHPSATSRPIIDFENKGTGIKMWGNGWHMYGFDIKRTAYGSKGIQLGGKYNILENVNAYDNGDTGISVSGKSVESFNVWPAYNLVLNCTAYMNKDLAQEDADGFAAKLYCGEGNVFRGCIAYCNADDGWDLYAKSESGSIGLVTIENCVTFGNGYNIDGTQTKGNGNGFKLGGESLPGNHTLINSISFGNKLKGIDSNSCPDNRIYNCTSVYNGGNNYAFYSEKITSYIVENCISLAGGKGDQVAGQKPSLRDDTNYFFSVDNGSRNYSEQTIDMTIFKGWNGNFKEYFGFEMQPVGTAVLLKDGENFESTIAKITTRDENNSIELKGFLELNDANFPSGAKLSKIEKTNWSNDGLLYQNGKSIEATGCKKGCKSEITAVDCIIAFALLSGAIFILAKRQKAK